MATTTPQAMPVGTILQMNRSFYEVIRAAAKTVWVQELQTRTGRTPSGSWATVPIRGAYLHDEKMMYRCNPTDGFVKIGIYRAYVYAGFVW